MRYNTRLAVSLCFLLLAATRLAAHWTPTFTFPDRVTVVKFPIEGNHDLGFVGLANGEIWRTSDGGKTWKNSAPPTPFHSDISDFAFQDQNIGWATHRSPGGGVLRTTDGGKSWTDGLIYVTGKSNSFDCVSICYVASTGLLLLATWDGGTFSSNTGGIGWNLINGAGLSGFLPLDSTNVTGSCATALGAFGWSSDGGKTWNYSNQVEESWQPAKIFGVGTALAVRDVNKYSLGGDWLTTDFGHSWNKRAQNLPVFPTGDVGSGNCGAIYIQSFVSGVCPLPALGEYPGRGVFLSVDTGMTWTSMGGPSNCYDTRFAVIGDTIYAGDERSTLWRYIMGPLDLGIPSVTIASPCQFLDTTFTLLAPACSDIKILSIDSKDSSVLKIGDYSAEIDRGKQGFVTYQISPRHGGADSCRVTYRLQRGGDVYDTTIRFYIFAVPSPSTLSLSSIRMNYGTQAECNARAITDSVRLMARGCEQIAIDSIVFRPDSAKFINFEFSKASMFALLNRDTTFYLTYSPRLAEKESGTILIFSFDGLHRHVDTIHANGTVLPTSRSFTVASDSLITRRCDSVHATIVVRNTTCGLLEFDSLTLPSGFVLPPAAGGQPQLPIGIDSNGTQVVVRFAASELTPLGLQSIAAIAHMRYIEHGQTIVFDTVITLDLRIVRGIPQAVVSSNMLDFGSVSTCAQAIAGFTLANTGCDTLAVQSLMFASGGAAYSLVRKPADTLSIGAFDSIFVQFKPSSSGLMSDTLLIQTNAGIRRIPISGFGVSDAVGINLPASVSLLSTLAQCDSSTATFTLSNSGCKPITIDSVRVADGPFTAHDIRDAILEVHESRNISVKYTPQVAGLDTRTLYVYFHGEDGGKRDTTVVLSGSAIAPPSMSVYLKPGVLSSSSQEVVTIPVYASSSSSATSFQSAGLSSVTLPLTFNTDLLTPIAVHSTVGTTSINGSAITLSLPPAFSLSGETVIASLDCRAFVTDTLATAIGLATSSVQSTSPNCFSLSTGQDVIQYTLIPDCSDSLISKSMAKELFAIESIVPNPSRDGFTLALDDRLHSGVRYELFDALGTLKGEGIAVNGESRIGTAGLPSGVYYLRLSEAAEIQTRRVVVAR